LSSNTYEPPEPDAFSPAEFGAWRGLLRLHATVSKTLDERLRAEHDLSLADYAALITLVGVPDRRLRMSELARRRLLHPSRITRLVDRLEAGGLIKREVDQDDTRSINAVLTKKGLGRLREAQGTHHQVVRELFLGQLSERDHQQMARLLDKALPGVVTEDVWPP
jgi:DNA-binding MarR family transcriptional regulator